MQHFYCSMMHKWDKNGRVVDVSFKCEYESKSPTHMCKEVQSCHYCMNIKHKKTPFQSQHGSSFKQNLLHRRRSCFYRKILSTVKKIKNLFPYLKVSSAHPSTPPSVHSQALLAGRRCGFFTRGPEDFIIPSSLPLPALPHSLSLPHSTPFISSSFRCTCIPATVNVPSSILSFIHMFFFPLCFISEFNSSIAQNTKLKIL